MPAATFEDRARGMLVALRAILPLTRERFEPGTLHVDGASFHEGDEHYFGWGHQDKTTFAAAVNTHRGEHPEDAFDVEAVQHVWAINLAVDSDMPIAPGDWRIQWGRTAEGEPITEACPVAFPITVIHL